MDDSTRSDKTKLDDQLRQQAHESAEDADRAKDKAGAELEDATEELSKIGHRISDTVEDVIPGDSDRDGH